MFQTRRSEIIPVEIPPATPDLFIHQAINEIQMDCLHRFQELESHMVEPGTIIGRKRIDVFQTDPPNPAELGILAELFGDIAQSAGRGILRGELGHARAAVDLDGEIPERGNDSEGTNELRASVNRFPAHRWMNVLRAGRRSTISPY